MRSMRVSIKTGFTSGENIKVGLSVKNAIEDGLKSVLDSEKCSIKIIQKLYDLESQEEVKEDFVKTYLYLEFEEVEPDHLFELVVKEVTAKVKQIPDITNNFKYRVTY